MLGHLIWLIAANGLEVNRPFTFSTLLMICKQIPESEDLSKGVDLQLRATLERDFRLCYPSKWSILRQLRKSLEEAKNLISHLSEEEIDEDLGWSFIGFTLVDEEWDVQVEAKIGAIIWSHLFKERELVGVALREGFNLAIETAPTSASRKAKFQTDISLLNPDCLKIIFSGACSVEAAEFLKVIEFEDSISEQQRIWFCATINHMTNSERTRLAVFITGLEFFTTSKIKVRLLDRDDEPCIQSSTCFSTLYLPPYKSLDNMLQKINYSTMDTSYGRV